MSDIKRLEAVLHGGLRESSNGEYVLYSDHQQALAEAKETIELQDAVLKPDNGINEQERDGRIIQVIDKEFWEVNTRGITKRLKEELAAEKDEVALKDACIKGMRENTKVLGEKLAEAEKRVEEAEKDMEMANERWEVERMKLVACGVASGQNTTESIKDRLSQSDAYYSGSYQSICDAVDREMVLRAKLEETENKLRACEHHINIELKGRDEQLEKANETLRLNEFDRGTRMGQQTLTISESDKNKPAGRLDVKEGKMLYSSEEREKDIKLVAESCLNNTPECYFELDAIKAARRLLK